MAGFVAIRSESDALLERMVAAAATPSDQHNVQRHIEPIDVRRDRPGLAMRQLAADPAENDTDGSGL